MLDIVKESYSERTGESIESDDFLEVATALSATYDADADGVVTSDEFMAGWNSSGNGRRGY